MCDLNPISVQNFFHRIRGRRWTGIGVHGARRTELGYRIGKHLRREVVRLPAFKPVSLDLPRGDVDDAY